MVSDLRQRFRSCVLGVCFLAGSEIIISPLFLMRSKSSSSSKKSSSHNNKSSRPFVAPSKSWLEGKRLGNVDNGLTKLDVERLIAIGSQGPIESIIGESVCAKDSPLATASDWDLAAFLQFDDKNNNISRQDTGQLVYRAIHENQYGPAREEAQSRLEHWEEWESLSHDNRYNNNNNTLSTTSSATATAIGLFDFECPNATFLIGEGFTLKVGLGSSLRRWGNVPIFLASLAYGRVFHYVMPAGKTMSLASCSGRNDLQCSFLPMSPCVLTQEEIDKAPLAPAETQQDLKMFLENNRNERVIRVEGFWNPSVKERIASLANTLTAMYYQQGNNSTSGNDKATIFDRIKQILSKKHDGLSVDDRIEAAAFLFITRPNRGMRQVLEKAMKESFPVGFDSSRTVGLPIRASDKCRSEAKCIGFQDYMHQVRNTFPMQDIDHILLTSEDETVLAAGRAYKNGDDVVEADIITNRYEVAQGTGQFFAKQMARQNISQEEVMTSTMTAWAFQLRAGYSFLNLCSNFHVLMESSIKLGCGLATMIRSQNVTCNVGGARGKPIIRNTP